MAKNNWIARLSMVGLAMTACAGLGQAAEKIRYEEIPGRIAPFGRVLEYRGFKVVTLDGEEHRGRKLRLEAHQVSVFQRDDTSENILSSQISRIEISQSGRFFHHIALSAEIPVAGGVIACGGLDDGPTSPACMVAVTAVLSPVWVYTAVTAPFYLAADGIAFLIPAKVYEIVH